MKALFMTTMVNGVPNLPPFEAEDGGTQLYHTVDGVLCGGYSCLGQVPVKGIPSILVQVWASNATLDAMDADNDYVFIEDVEEPEEVAPMRSSRVYASLEDIPIEEETHIFEIASRRIAQGEDAEIVRVEMLAELDALTESRTVERPFGVRDDYGDAGDQEEVTVIDHDAGVPITGLDMAPQGPSLAAPEPQGKPPSGRKFNRGKALAYLLAHGQAAKLAQTFPGAAAQAVLAVLAIHGITDEQWRAGQQG